MSKSYDGLSYEQLRLLKILRDSGSLGEIEATDLTKKADCSWDELFDLSIKKLLYINKDEHSFSMKPVISDNGLQTLLDAEKDNII